MNMKTMLGAIIVSAAAVAAADAPSFQWQVGQAKSDWAVLNLNFYDSDGNGLRDKNGTGDFKFENKERVLPIYAFDGGIGSDGKAYVRDASGNLHEVCYLKFSLYSTYSGGTASGWMGNTTDYGVNYGDANTQKTAIKWADVWNALKSGRNYVVDVKRNVDGDVRKVCTLNLFSFALKWMVESKVEWDALRFGFINEDGKPSPFRGFQGVQKADGTWQGFVEAVTNYTGKFYFDISENGTCVGRTGWGDWWGSDGAEGKELTWNEVLAALENGRFVRKFRSNSPAYATEVGTLTLAARLGQELNFSLADGRIEKRAYSYAVDASDAGTVVIDFDKAEPELGVYTLVTAPELMNIDLSKWTLRTTVNGVEMSIKGRRAMLRCAKNDEGRYASLQLKISLGGLALIIR